MTQAQGTTGRLLADRYRLGEVLGRGGMGTVWRASDETLGRVVAVKELRFPGNVDEDEKRRLITRTLREAKATARIRSTGAVTVFDVVEEDDRPWIVMELVESRSLSDVIRDDGPLTPRRAAEVGLAVLDVLRAAHREGILHRDVKPSNVLIADDGRVVLTDFGIAQVEGDPSVTSTGMLVGAPSYISPERARGHRPGPAADLWSLGTLLYAAVEGHPPYDKGSAIATLTAVMTEPIEPPKNAGPLAEVIYGLLRKDPDQRLAEPDARRMLLAVVHAPEAPEGAVPPADATAVVPLPSPRENDDHPPRPAADPSPPAPQRNVTPPRPAAAPAAAAAAAVSADRPAPADPAPAAPTGAPRPSSDARTSVAPAPPSGPPSARRPLPAFLAEVPRRTLAIAAAVVALLLVVVIAAVALSSGGDDKGGKNSAEPGASSSADPETSPSASGTSGEKPSGGESSTGDDDGKKEDDKGKDDKDNSGKGSGDSGKNDDGKQDGSGGIPAGYRSYSNNQFHFTMALPDGWKQIGIAGAGSGVRLGPSAGSATKVQVDYTSTPGSDALKAWRDQEPSTRGSSSNYSRVSMESVEWRGYRTVADWTFTRTSGGVKEKVLNRGFVVDGTHGYAIMFTAPASEWDSAANKLARETFFNTFEPTD